MEVRHFIETDDFTKEEYLEMLKVIRTLKDAERKGIRLPLLKDQSLAMMFDQPSTRTRVSFEAAMTQLGGHALYLETKTLHCGEDRETIKDTAQVLSGMCDAIEIRTESQDTIIELAKYSDVPVFSGMSSKCMHPTQALCDLFTMTRGRRSRTWSTCSSATTPCWATTSAASAGQRQDFCPKWA